jgi:hypothetical protein
MQTSTAPRQRAPHHRRQPSNRGGGVGAFGHYRPRLTAAVREHAAAIRQRALDADPDQQWRTPAGYLRAVVRRSRRRRLPRRRRHVHRSDRPPAQLSAPGLPRRRGPRSAHRNPAEHEQRLRQQPAPHSALRNRHGPTTRPPGPTGPQGPGCRPDRKDLPDRKDPAARAGRKDPPRDRAGRPRRPSRRVVCRNTAAAKLLCAISFPPGSYTIAGRARDVRYSITRGHRTYAHGFLRVRHGRAPSEACRASAAAATDQPRSGRFRIAIGERHSRRRRPWLAQRTTSSSACAGGDEMTASLGQATADDRDSRRPWVGALAYARRDRACA